MPAQPSRFDLNKAQREWQQSTKAFWQAVKKVNRNHMEEEEKTIFDRMESGLSSKLTACEKELQKAKPDFKKLSKALKDTNTAIEKYSAEVSGKPEFPGLGVAFDRLGMHIDWQLSNLPS